MLAHSSSSSISVNILKQEFIPSISWEDVNLAASIFNFVKMQNTNNIFSAFDISNSSPVISESVAIKSDLNQFFQDVAEAKICAGNEDFKDPNNQKLEKGLNLNFLDKDGNVKALIETQYRQNSQELSTIKSINCEVLVKNKERCDNCMPFRKQLFI